MRNFSTYVGIVVQNNDPDKMGRIKVYVPGITTTVYDNWTDSKDDKEFSFIDASIIPIMDQLKQDLPWCDCATSVFGGDTSQLNDKETPVALSRPSDGMVQSPPTDAFENAVYTPGDYSGTEAGNYSVPNVGAHVYIFFKEGNTNFPVYYASAHGKNEWNMIFKTDYPTDYENSNSATEPYQNKHVLNSSKHTLEFIDSDEKEEVRLSHYSGSNFQMLNDYTSRFTVKDDYTLIEENKFETVKKSSKINITENQEVAIGGTQNVKIEGTQDVTINSDQSITVNGNITMKATGSITIESANGKIVLDGSGVTITGSAINLN